jgi:hypothetical protein
MARYAEGTRVDVEVSQAEIRSLLRRHGCEHFATADEPTRAAIQFILGGLPYRFTVERPDPAVLRAEYVEEAVGRGTQYKSTIENRASYIDWNVKAGGEWRRRWRARLLWLKATLEFATGEGADEVAQALLAHLVLPTGETMGGWTAKQLPDAFANGAMPPLQLTGAKR